MPTTTGKSTLAEIAMKYGGRPLPADDPLHNGSWHVGASKPYKVRPAGTEKTRTEPAPSQGKRLPPLMRALDLTEDQAKKLLMDWVLQGNDPVTEANPLEHVAQMQELAYWARGRAMGEPEKSLAPPLPE